MENEMENGARFASKRNNVYYRDKRVEKVFSDQARAKAEAELLTEYRRMGADVPLVLACRDNVIEMEFIPGETIPDFLERMSAAPDDWETEIRKVAGYLRDWFVKFYDAVDYRRSSEIRGDVNGRNFIIANGRAVSVDFEERVYGTIEEDIGKLLAYIRTYDLPDGKAQRLLARVFYLLAMESLDFLPEEMIKQYTLELAKMSERRDR